MKSLQKVWGLQLLHQAICNSNRGIHSHSSAISNFCLEEFLNHCDEYNPPIPGNSLESLRHTIFFLIQTLPDYLYETNKQKSLLWNDFQTGEFGMLKPKYSVSRYGSYLLIILSLQMRKWRLGDIKWLAQEHPASKQENCDSNLRCFREICVPQHATPQKMPHTKYAASYQGHS